MTVLFMALFSALVTIGAVVVCTAVALVAPSVGRGTKNAALDVARFIRSPSLKAPEPKVWPEAKLAYYERYLLDMPVFEWAENPMPDWNAVVRVEYAGLDRAIRSHGVSVREATAAMNTLVELHERRKKMYEVHPTFLVDRPPRSRPPDPARRDPGRKRWV